MNNEWPGDDNDLDLALNGDVLEKLLNEAAQTQQLQLGANSEFEGFDGNAGNSWIYPNNMPLRSYQHSIVQAALYRNTLVVLPTGLGKTFIASVVMYNLHRWYPQGKLIFMAPTRPLVSQQIAACQKIMPFPPDDTVELTGRLPRAKRAELWMSKRVFFVTPQVVQSDMLDVSGEGPPFPFNAIKLLVVDEAHRAKGRYAYTQVTDSLMARNRYFRVLALSATPGRTMDDVAAVCRNLYISHLEVRWDQSIDVQPYIHQRSIRSIVVAMTEAIKEARARMLEIIDPYLRQLIAADVLKSARGNITRNTLLYDQSRYQEHVAQGQRHPEHSMITSNFSMCISLYHAMELLERHGLRVFVNNFDSDERGRDKFVLRDPALRDLVEHTRQQLGSNPLEISTRTMTNGEVPPMPAQLDFGHPKYEQARQVMLSHFEVNPDSRAIVFCEYRESVMLIQRLLLQHRPQIRPRCFVGQSSSGGGICALTQKEQLQIMSDFRSGICNVLVATSIGEEGLDVGEVELIVCFDICSSNPTRFVQRIGRTGRQKRGQVVMLVTEGREQQVLKEVLANKDQMNRKLLTSPLVKRSLYEYAPRLVPPQFNPRCDQRFMEQPVTPVKDSTTPSPKGKAKARKQPKVAAVRSHDLRKFFKQSQDKFLKDQPVYEMSERSQQFLQQQMENRSVKIKNFLLDTQPDTVPNCNPPATVTPSSSSSTLSSNLEESQRLRKLTRLLQATKPLLSEAQRGQDLAAQLQDKQLPQSLKLFLLQSNEDFVREILGKMQQQQALPDGRLNTRQQRTRRNYELIMEVCNGQVEQLLKEKTSVSSAELTVQDLLQPSAQLERHRQFELNCREIFKDLHEQGLCADNHELVQQQLEQLKQRNLEQTMKEQFENDINFDFEQWEEQQQPAEETVEKIAEEVAEDAEKEQPNCSVSQSQWQPLSTAMHSSTPVRQPPANPSDGSMVDSSQLMANLSRLNCVLSAASTPVQLKQPKIEVKNLIDELDENLSDFELLSEVPETPSKRNITALEANEMSTPEVLDIDLDDFMEPLPEERELQLRSGTTDQQPPGTPRNLSPDLFAEESNSPWKPPMTLAAKLAAKTSAAASVPVTASASAPAPIPATYSPEQRKRITTAGQDKSPSIFENYLQRMRGRGQLSRAAQRLHAMTSTVGTAAKQETDSGQEEDSPIVRRRSAKRKICTISDDEEETEIVNAVPDTQLLADDTFEQVAETQLDLMTPPQRKQGRKRLKHNSFVLQEAEQSGSDHDEDEAGEVTIGAYLKDSVIVSSGEEDHNDTDAHALYLQAMRSPIQRPGAFKMPPPRVYHDESIFSQTVEAEPSQYYPCSFVVNDDSVTQQEMDHDVSECPLERAERILKEERRQRRLQKRQARDVAPIGRVLPKRRRGIHTINDSSDEENDVFLIN